MNFLLEKYKQEVDGTPWESETPRSNPLPSLTSVYVLGSSNECPLQGDGAPHGQKNHCTQRELRCADREEASRSHSHQEEVRLKAWA